jgi:hypothetical protein
MACRKEGASIMAKITPMPTKMTPPTPTTTSTVAQSLSDP